ncbi:MAG TPA: hypothetical protein VMV52_06205 [Candidatus Nanopelagicaceae bacterium]|nr:hypothetical protein [Candidatus Nanopelagicaceae bacterium]
MALAQQELTEMVASESHLGGKMSAMYRRLAVLATRILLANSASLTPAFGAAISLTAGATITSSAKGLSNAPTAAGTQMTANLSITLGSMATGDNLVSATYTVFNGNGADVTSSARFTANAAPDPSTTVSVTGPVYTLDFNTGASASSHRIGSVSFNPAGAGAYIIKVSTGSIGTTADSFTHLDNSTVATFYVSGSSLAAGGSGLGTESGTAYINSSAKIDVVFPAHAASAWYVLTAANMNITKADDGLLGASTISVPYNGADYGAGVKVTMPANADAADALLTVRRSTVGTGTLTLNVIIASNGNPTVLNTWSLNWATPATFSPLTTQTAFSPDGAASQPSSGGNVFARGTKPDVLVAHATITVEDAVGNPSGGQKVSAYIIGPGYLSFAGAGPITGRNISKVFAGNTGQLNVFSDGNSGNSTITISIGSALLATYPVTFFGNVVTLTATSSSKQFPLRNGAGTILVSAKDSGGNPVSDAQLWVVNSNPGVAEVVAKSFAGNFFPYTVNALKVGQTTVSFVDAKGLVAQFNLKTYASTGSIADISLALDKAVYAPKARAILTVTAKNADGSSVPDGKYQIFDGPLLPSVTSLTSPFSGGYVTLSGGKAKYAFTVPAAEGEFSFTGAIGSDPKIVPPIQGDKVSANAVVKAASVAGTPTPVIPFAADQIEAATAAVNQLATTITTLSAAIIGDLKAFSDAIAKL